VQLISVNGATVKTDVQRWTLNGQGSVQLGMRLKLHPVRVNADGTIDSWLDTLYVALNAHVALSDHGQPYHPLQDDATVNYLTMKPDAPAILVVQAHPYPLYVVITSATSS